jgi:histidyl-tRNA synthetase
MSKKTDTTAQPQPAPASGRPVPRLPRGLRDVGPEEMRATEAMLARIRAVYERYGFDGLTTPAFEYTDALGKFLPDQDRPNAGVFSLKDDDEQWVSLRYDLTAPLARYVAENFDALPKPYRGYRLGTVWRNEKPGPGRFREFMQFDADTVGTDHPAADAEICMLAADAMEAVGIPRGDYRIRVASRKLIDGLLEAAGLPAAEGERRLTVMRAVDKLDRLGLEGVRLLLGKGRQDESGAFTPGADLAPEQAERVLGFVGTPVAERGATLDALEKLVGGTEAGRQGIAELRVMAGIWDALGFGIDRISIDPSIVRGLEYYTGAVFEAELTFAAKSEDGEAQRFGSVGGGGRYDGLVARFRDAPVPATGFSIGVSRLTAALTALGKLEATGTRGPVVVLVLDKPRIADSLALTATLRAAGIRAECYLGTSGMKPQMKYADRRGAPCVIMQGGDELARGEVTIKDLVAGAKAAEGIADRAQWTEARPAQVSVPVADMVATVKDILARQAAG